MSTSTPFSADERVRAELLPGELLIWTGRPDPRVLFTAYDALLVPFSLLWCGFAIFWSAKALASAGVLFAAFGLGFVAFGLYFVLGRFIVKALQKRGTVYAVTDRRALVATGTRSISQSPVRDRPMTVRRRGSHVSVLIGPPPRIEQALYANTGLDLWVRDIGTVAFWDVGDVDGLLAALRRVQAS